MRYENQGRTIHRRNFTSRRYFDLLNFPSLGLPVQCPMMQRINSRLCNIRIRIDIETSIKFSVRPTPFSPAETGEVLPRVHICRNYIWVLLQIPRSIKKRACRIHFLRRLYTRGKSHLRSRLRNNGIIRIDVWIYTPILVTPVFYPMEKWINTRQLDVRIFAQVILSIKVSIRITIFFPAKFFEMDQWTHTTLGNVRVLGHIPRTVEVMLRLCRNSRAVILLAITKHRLHCLQH